MQRLDLHHRALVGLLVVGVEAVAAALYEHRSLSGADPREIELRECLYDATEHLGADVAFPGVSVVGYVLSRQSAPPLEVKLRFAHSLRLRPLHEVAEALDGSLRCSVCFLDRPGEMLLAPDIYVRFIFDTVCHISEFSHQSHDLGNAVYRSQFHGVIVIFGIE